MSSSPARSRKSVLRAITKIVFERCDADRCRIAYVSSDGEAYGELTEAEAGDCRRPRWAASGRELA